MISKTALNNNVPKELQQRKQWICWEARERDGRITKVPVSPNTRIPFNINNQKMWMTFDNAISAYERNHLSGIGFVFTTGDPYIGIDIDKCVENDGTYSTLAREFMQTIRSYTEFSPSGRGIHIICKGFLGKGRNKNEKLGLEIYNQDRYFTFTGNVLFGMEQIVEQTDAVGELRKKYLTESQKTETPKIDYSSPTRRQTLPESVDTIGILSRMKNSANYIALYRGSWNGVYQSQSQADLAFCNALAFATGKDEVLMDRIFRESGLYRAKWDQPHYNGGTTYGENTIRKAIDGCTSVYQPKAQIYDERCNVNEEPVKTNMQDELPPWYQKDPKSGTIHFKSGILAEHLCNFTNVKFIGGSLYLYQNGVYVELQELMARSIIQVYLRPELMRHAHVRDTLELWKTALVSESVEINEKMAEYIINLNNGLYNTRTKELLPHSPSHVSTVQLNCSFVDKAQCPRFMGFLSESLQPELIPVVQELFGYLLVPITKAQKAFILYGPGRTGKSTLIGVIEFIVGNENISNVPWQNLESRFDKASLFGKLLNTCADLPAKPLSDTAAFKIFTGEDAIYAERKGKDAFSFKNKARLLFSCNQLPQNDIDRTDGFYRRLLVIPFLKQISEERMDSNLLETFKEEVDGIVQWGLKGLERLSFNGYKFTESELTNRILKGYQSSSQSVEWFVDEHCELVEGGKMYSKELYDLYERKCKENGMHPKVIAKFVLELEAYCGNAIQRSHEPKTKRAIIKGISLKQEVPEHVA